jgi:hypothetical protein
MAALSRDRERVKTDRSQHTAIVNNDIISELLISYPNPSIGLAATQLLTIMTSTASPDVMVDVDCLGAALTKLGINVSTTALLAATKDERERK